MRRAILDGRYVHGEKLLAERQFAVAFEVSRATIRTAPVRLESEALVTRLLGAGTFANFQPRTNREDFAELTGPLELIKHQVLSEAIRSRDIDEGVAIVTSHLHSARRRFMVANSEGGE